MSFIWQHRDFYSFDTAAIIVYLKLIFETKEIQSFIVLEAYTLRGKHQEVDWFS